MIASLFERDMFVSGCCWFLRNWYWVNRINFGSSKVADEEKLRFSGVFQVAGGGMT